MKLIVRYYINISLQCVFLNLNQGTWCLGALKEMCIRGLQCLSFVLRIKSS